MQPASGSGPNKLIMPAAIVVIIILVAVAAGIYLSKGSTSTTTVTSTATVSNGGSSSVVSGSNTVIPIVAAENFWGDLASQLAGVHGNVTSIVQDPNTDPHQYQSNPADAKLIADAKVVILNGMQYDTWASQLVNSSATPGQVVLTAQNIVGLPDVPATYANVNPHLWYSPWYVNDTVHAMYNALVNIDPTDKAYFNANYATLNASLYSTYMSKEDAMRAQYGGPSTVTQEVLRQYAGPSGTPTNIEATESIVQFFANATGVNILTPVPFMFAVAEGDDPSPADIATFEQQLTAGNSSNPNGIGCLEYNIQTVMPVTQQIKSIATQYEIPIAVVSETLQPPGFTFQQWMGGEVAQLQNCLNSVALGNLPRPVSAETQTANPVAQAVGAMASQIGGPIRDFGTTRLPQLVSAR
jgi:zinc/manganese transport system substrate-binding protein